MTRLWSSKEFSIRPSCVLFGGNPLTTFWAINGCDAKSRCRHRTMGSHNPYHGCWLAASLFLMARFVPRFWNWMERPGCDLNSLRFESEHSLRIPCDAPSAPRMRFVGRYVLQRICLGVFWDAPHNLNRITEARVDRGSGRKAEAIGCPFCELGIQAGSIMGLDT